MGNVQDAYEVLLEAGYTRDEISNLSIDEFAKYAVEAKLKQLREAEKKELKGLDFTKDNLFDALDRPDLKERFRNV